MKKRINVRRLIGRRSYSTTELAGALGVHPQTIRSWRVDGLRPIDPNSYHALYLGSEVKKYYLDRKVANKVVLKPNQYYCLSCKSAVEATNQIEVDQKAKLGRNKLSMRYEGDCTTCGKRVCRFFAKSPNLLAEGKDINIDRPPSLYRSYTSRKDNHV